MTDRLFGKIVSYTHKDAACDIALEEGVLRVEGISKNVMRVRIHRGTKLHEDVSYSIEGENPSRRLIFEETDRAIMLRTDGMGLSFNKDAFAIDIYDGAHTLLSAGAPVAYRLTGETIDARIAEENENVYALGERITPLGRRGYRCENWNTDNPFPHSEANEAMYSSFPFMIASSNDGKRVYGYFLDSSYRSSFDVGKTDWNRYVIRVAKGEFNAYIFAGASLKEILRAYAALTGRHAMAPLWALGYHQSRWSYASTEEARAVAETFRAKKIPCDAIWYDIDHMDGFRPFTQHKERFGDFKEHCKELEKKKFHAVAIIDPGIKADEEGAYAVHDEGAKNGYFIKDALGNDYVGAVWPGKAKFPDFSIPEAAAWWGDLHAFYYDIGIDGFWNDMNEPSDASQETNTVPNGLCMYDDGRWSNFERMHNAYALLEAKATVGGMLRLKPEARPFLLTRAGFSGIQKYAAKWTGDNITSWAHLKASVAQVLNMGLSGVGFVGADVGGFGMTNANPELIARWMQLGAFYPFFRNHAAEGTGRQEPWSFGENAQAICKEAISLRYRLLPYFYQLFREMHTKGDPIIRPLFWRFSDDHSAYAIADEFMLGDYVLVAPVVEEGARTRKVYFPKGLWYDYVSGARYEGAREYIVEAPLEKIPVYVKAGSVIPTIPFVESTVDIDPSFIAFEVFPGDGEFREEYYEDDMTTNAYTTGAFHLHPVSLTRSKFSIAYENGSNIKRTAVKFFSHALKGALIPGFVENGLWHEKEFFRATNIAVEF